MDEYSFSVSNDIAFLILYFTPFLFICDRMLLIKKAKITIYESDVFCIFKVVRAVFYSLAG
jgi:hypothetical protein